MVNEPISTYNSEFSDYVLLGKDCKALAVVEAKKSSVDARHWRRTSQTICDEHSKAIQL